MKRTENRSVNFDLQLRKAKTCFELLNLSEKGQNKVLAARRIMCGYRFRPYVL